MPAPTHPLPVEFKAVNGQMCMTVQSYKNLAKNLADVLRWVDEAEYRLRYYTSAK